MRKHSDIIIMGGGPAGLSAAHELALNRKNATVLEADDSVGGISRTIHFKDCHFDLGGHRFHTDLPEVMTLWERLLGDDFLTRNRLSRIRYDGRFFDYPLTPANALFGMGIVRSSEIMASYVRARLAPSKEERTFEQWVSNRFGRKLFEIFFRSYTEKVWGIPCDELSRDWAAQRIRGLSLGGAVRNALFPGKGPRERSIIDRFRYPKYGPGMLYGKMAEEIRARGSGVLTGMRVRSVRTGKRGVRNVLAVDRNGTERKFEAEHIISSIPIDELILMIEPAAPEHVLDAARRLRYRSLVSVSVILKTPNPFPDQWVYVHDPDIRMGRIQNFGNWSPYMVGHADQTALGLEYFCDEGDEFWNRTDDGLIRFGLEELGKTGLADPGRFTDGFVTRVRKAYPTYHGLYGEYVRILREYLDTIENLQTIGRNGMFRYDNMDRSVFSGILAARNIPKKTSDIWNIDA